MTAIMPYLTLPSTTWYVAKRHNWVGLLEAQKIGKYKARYQDSVVEEEDHHTEIFSLFPYIVVTVQSYPFEDVNSITVLLPSFSTFSFSVRSNLVVVEIIWPNVTWQSDNFDVPKSLVCHVKTPIPPFEWLCCIKMFSSVWQFWNSYKIKWSWWCVICQNIWSL